MDFVKLNINEPVKIRQMSQMATEIVREHFDPIIGKAQNDYMLEKFQSEEAIRGQLEHGYQYYFVYEKDHMIGFLAFYPRENAMYLSKFYLYKNHRGKGYSHQMLDFVIDHTREAGLPAIELNVNRNNSAVFVYEKLGFQVIREEKNDIGSGFYMDDYVFRLNVA